MAIKINGSTVISDSQAITSTSTISATGNITGGNVVTAGTISATTVIANVTPPAGGAISTTGNVTGGNLLTGGLVSVTGGVTASQFNGSGAGLTSIPGGNVTGTVPTATTAGTVTTAAQGNITSVGTLTSLTVTGNTTSGNLLTGGLISSTGNITGGNILGGANVNATTHTGATVSVTGTITAGNLATGGTASATGTITGGNLATAGTISSTGNITGGNISAGIGTFSGAGSFSGNVNMNSQYINNVTNPVQNQDVATKSYVDTMSSTGIAYHSPVAVATTGTLATATGGTVTYNNGTAGVGATLTTTGTFLLIDGANVQTIGTRILVKNEANAAWNGVYTYANTTAIVRSTDTDEYGPDSTTQLSINDYFFTSGGVTNEGTAFIVSAPTGTITFGTSNITFSTFSTSQVYDAGTGLTLTGTSFSVNASQTQITSVGTLGSLAVTANVAGGNLTTAGAVSATGAVTGSQFNGSGAGLTSIPGANVTGTVASATTAGTVTTAAQGNITSVGTLTSLAVSGTITAATVNAAAIGNSGAAFTGASISAATIGNASAVHNGATVSVTGTVTGASVVGGVMTGTSVSVTGAVTGASVVGGVMTGTSVSVTGAITGAGLTGTSLTVSTGTVTLGNIVNSNANGVGNIGSSTTYFNTVFAKATSAQYADLAELYTADAEYEPGTVVEFGGTAEVTLSNKAGSTRVAGVVSTNPSYIMNATLQAEHVAVVALQGRVPCKVIGPVSKGDIMVSSGGGYAKVDNNAKAGTIIGKALEVLHTPHGVIEVVVGRN